jgi:hypothetical protein
MEQLPAGEGEELATQGYEAEGERAQRFLFGPWVFNVSGALAIVAECPRRTWYLPVAQWARFYGLADGEGQTVSLFTALPDLDRDYAMTTDLSEPVLIATMQNEDGEAFPLLIDGTHRLYRAYVERIAELPTYVLTVDETLAIREDAYYR